MKYDYDPIPLDAPATLDDSSMAEKADEIFEQAQRFSAALRRDGERLSNVVLMGMGEPFHNYDPVLTAIRRLMADLGIGARHITVSTVGLVPRIRRFAQEGLQVKLAISLHATHDHERAERAG